MKFQCNASGLEPETVQSSDPFTAAKTYAVALVTTDPAWMSEFVDGVTVYVDDVPYMVEAELQPRWTATKKGGASAGV